MAKIYPEHPAVLWVGFAPDARGLSEATLVLEAEDPEVEKLQVRLVGEGVAASAVLEPPEADFGEVSAGVAHLLRLSVSNPAVPSGRPGAALRFTSRGSEGFQETPPEVVGDEGFWLEWPPADYPAAEGIPPGESLELRIWFAAPYAGQHEATLRLFVNVPESPVLEIPLRARATALAECDLVAKPFRLDFGRCVQGWPCELLLALENLSSEPSKACTIQEIRLGPAAQATGAFMLVDAPAEAFVLHPGETRSVRVVFDAAAEGLYEGEIELVTASSTLVVPMAGAAVPNPLEVTPDLLDFGEVVRDRRKDLSVVVKNHLAQPVVLESIMLQSERPGDFDIVPRPDTPFTLGAGQQAPFAVRFRPRAEGSSLGRVYVRAEALRQHYVVELRGAGMPGPMTVDTFEFEPLEVDVIFVIDDSPSMAPMLDDVERNLQGYVGWAKSVTYNGHYVDLHLGVTTTSVGGTGDEDGRLLPLEGDGPRVVDLSMPDAVARFLQNARVGASGNPVRRPLRAAQLALSEPLLSGANAGFYRPGARLAIVVVTAGDDEDSSPVGEFEQFFVGLKGERNRNKVSVNAVMPPAGAQLDADQGCIYEPEASGWPERLFEIVARTSGQLGHLCAPDWELQLRRLWSMSWHPRTRYYLSHQPRAETLSVRVDDVRLEQYGSKGEKRWEFNSTANAIDFALIAPIEPWHRITVSYEAIPDSCL